jgi:polyphosphate kinase
MAHKHFKSHELYLNRELSWLEFNDRVLREGLSEQVPLFERLKFLAIVSSNLDEFFMIRVAGLLQQQAAGLTRRDAAGMTPAGQLEAIGRRTHRLVAEQSAGIREALSRLAEHGIEVLDRDAWTAAERDFLRAHFAREILPVLTPLAVGDLDPPPLLPGLQLQVAAVIASRRDGQLREKVAVVPVPTQLSRFIAVPSDKGLRLARAEQAIAANLDLLFPGCRVLADAAFRVTRDGDVAIQDDDASDLLQAVEEAVRGRRRRSAVRVEISEDADPRLREWLQQGQQLRDEQVYAIAGLLDATALWQIVNRPGNDDLRYPEWPPQPPRDLREGESLWEALQDHDVLLVHPYERFDPVIQLLAEAAEDRNVLAIKQTLYRTSGDSPIVQALERAAANGKEVTVLVELKARFDESKNVQWARRLEDVGCHVVYGIVGLKTHAKAILVIRRESSQIRRYVHLSTGNYNDRTARMYSDIGLMTSDREIAADVAALFNLLTGYSEAVGWTKLTVEPHRLRQRFVELIDREIQASTPEQPGLIMAKVNSLQDSAICRALYRASQAGVRIRLNVRGICCLRPGLPGVSENIEVRSIIDRYLEHARLFYFYNGGHEEVYLSSADWMRRNLDFRVETLFPVAGPALRRRLIEALKTYFADNVKACRLRPDGGYEPVERQDPPLRAQQRLYEQAVEAAKLSQQIPERFHPLMSPREE